MESPSSEEPLPPKLSGAEIREAFLQYYESQVGSVAISDPLFAAESCRVLVMHLLACCKCALSVQGPPYMASISSTAQWLPQHARGRRPEACSNAAASCMYQGCHSRQSAWSTQGQSGVEDTAACT